MTNYAMLPADRLLSMAKAVQACLAGVSQRERVEEIAAIRNRTLWFGYKPYKNKTDAEIEEYLRTQLGMYPGPPKVRQTKAIVETLIESLRDADFDLESSPLISIPLEDYALLRSFIREYETPKGPMSLDDTPLDTDWDNINDLFKDIVTFLKTRPNHTLIPMDDPGMHHYPQRIPRLGWSAYLEGASDEDVKQWTIPLSKAQGSKASEYLRTSEGRRQLIRVLIKASCSAETSKEGGILKASLSSL